MSEYFDVSIFQVAAPIFLALVLVGAALPKFKQADEFVGVIANYRLLPEAWVIPFAKALPVLEIICALGLMVPVLRAGAGWLAGGLFMLFALALGINIGRGRTHIDCGCVRRPTSKSRIGMFHLSRALGLAVVSAYVALTPFNPVLSIAPFMLGVAVAAMLMLIYLSADLMVGLPGKTSNSLSVQHGRGT